MKNKIILIIIVGAVLYFYIGPQINIFVNSDTVDRSASLKFLAPKDPRLISRFDKISSVCLAISSENKKETIITIKTNEKIRRFFELLLRPEGQHSHKNDPYYHDLNKYRILKQKIEVQVFEQGVLLTVFSVRIPHHSDQYAVHASEGAYVKKNLSDLLEYLNTVPYEVDKSG